VTRRARSARRAVASYVAKAPGTHVLLLIVTVTTLMQRGLDETTATRVLRHASTNLFQMTRDAPRVLFLSAFLLDHGHLLVEMVVFTLVMVPVERWIGTYRWLGVFAAGHVGATLATTVGIWMQVRSGRAGNDLAYPIDVGVSYGLYAVAAILPRRLPRPAAEIAVAIVIGITLRGVVTSGTYTEWGHAAAVAIGFSLGPLVDPRSASPSDQHVPHHGSLRTAWHWLATPPHRSRRSPSAHAQVLGLVALACAGALLAVLTWTGTSDLELPTGTTRTQAIVVDPNVPCTPHCTNTIVRYHHGRTTYREALRLPAGIAVRRGEHLDVDIDTADPSNVHLPHPARRVSVNGLLGATAVALACTGAVLLTRGRRTTYEVTTHSKSSTGEPDKVPR
jgi:hypothetical protein